MGNNINTQPNGDGKWENRKDNAKKASNVFDTKAEAVEAGKAQAQRERSEHTIKGLDGRIQNKNSYGNDPNPPKDKK
jgi:hypothetical protein